MTVHSTCPIHNSQYPSPESISQSQAHHGIADLALESISFPSSAGRFASTEGVEPSGDEFSEGPPVACRTPLSTRGTTDHSASYTPNKKI